MMTVFPVPCDSKYCSLIHWNHLAALSRTSLLLVPTVTMESDSRIKAYKFVAYSAVSFSIVAVLSVVISLPMVYNYVGHVRRQMHHEINLCKVISCST